MSSSWLRCPPGSGWAGSPNCRNRSRCAISSRGPVPGCRPPRGVCARRGDPDLPVSRVAVCGGAGDSLLATAARAGVQAYLTADLRHHPADEHRRASDVALVDVAHWASEYPWCGQAAALLRSHFADTLRVRVSTIRTDPWNIGAHE